MTLLKAYLLQTDNPFVMVKCWYEDINNIIWKAESKETYKELLQDVIREVGQAGWLTKVNPETGKKLKLTTGTLNVALKEILQLPGVKGELDKKGKSGQIPTRTAHDPKSTGILWEGKETESGKHSSYWDNLYKIKSILRPFENDPDHKTSINRIISAVDEKLERMPKHWSEMTSGKFESDWGDDEKLSDEDKERREKSQFKEADEKQQFKKFSDLEELLQSISKLSNFMDDGRIDAEGFVIYPREITVAIDKLFDWGANIVAVLDNIETEKYLSKRYSGTNFHEESRKLEETIINLLEKEVKITTDDGLENMSLMDAIEELYPQFTGKRAFRSSEEIEDIHSKLTQAKKKKLGLRRKKAIDLEALLGQDMEGGTRGGRFLAGYHKGMKTMRNALMTKYIQMGRIPRLKGKIEKEIQILVTGISHMNKKLDSHIEYPPKPKKKDNKPLTEEEEENYNQAKGKHESKMKRRYVLRYEQLPSKEEFIARGEKMRRLKASKKLEIKEQEKLEAEEEKADELINAFESTGKTITWGGF